MLGGRRGLVYAVFGEDVVEVRALRGIIDHFKTFLDFSSHKDSAFFAAATCVQPTGTVRLGIVSSFGFSA